MYYVLYGNDQHSLRKELTSERQTQAQKDIQLVKEFAMAIFYEDLLDETDVITFVKIIDQRTEDVVFSIEEKDAKPRMYENEQYFKTS